MCNEKPGFDPRSPVSVPRERFMSTTIDRTAAAWRSAVAPFQQADTRRSVWQLVNSLLPYFLLLIFMYASLSVSYWLTLLLAVFASGFMMRVFIIFHDC